MTREQRARHNAQLRDVIGRIERAFFKPGTKLTLVARRPDDVEAYEIITNDDDMDAVIEAVRRGAEGERGER